MVAEYVLHRLHHLKRQKTTECTLSVSFLACGSIYAIARYMPSPVRLSVRLSVHPSVCHTGRSVKDG